MLADRMRAEGFEEEFMRVDDFPILKEIVEQNVDFKKHVRAEGGFQITDRSIYDDVLKEVNRRLKELRKPGRIIFAEFSRNNYTRALGYFDREVLDRSLLVYIYCPYEVCYDRIVRGFKSGHPEDLDAHMVPTDLMETYYRRDDYEELFLKSEEELKEQAPAPIVVVKNDAEGLQRLRGELDRAPTILRKTRSTVSF